MKYIISTTGSNIEFKLNAERLLVIESVIPLEVTDQEFVILQDRLGSQIKLVEIVSDTTGTSNTNSSDVSSSNDIEEEEDEDEEESEGGNI